MQRQDENAFSELSFTPCGVWQASMCSEKPSMTTIVEFIIILKSSKADCSKCCSRPSEYSGPPRQIFSRQGLHSGNHFTGVPPLPPSFSIFQNPAKDQASVFLPPDATLLLLAVNVCSEYCPKYSKFQLQHAVDVSQNIWGMFRRCFYSASIDCGFLRI